MEGLVACLLGLLIEPPWTVKNLPMWRDPAPADPLEVDAPALDPPPEAEPAPDVVTFLLWLGAGTWHALWHSSRVMKLLLLPWQLPYQNCMHLEVMTS